MSITLAVGTDTAPLWARSFSRVRLFTPLTLLLQKPIYLLFASFEINCGPLHREPLGCHRCTPRAAGLSVLHVRSTALRTHCNQYNMFVMSLAWTAVVCGSTEYKRSGNKRNGVVWWCLPKETWRNRSCGLAPAANTDFGNFGPYKGARRLLTCCCSLLGWEMNCVCQQQNLLSPTDSVATEAEFANQKDAT